MSETSETDKSEKTNKTEKSRKKVRFALRDDAEASGRVGGGALYGRRVARAAAHPRPRAARLKMMALHMRSLFTRKRRQGIITERLMVGSGPMAESARLLEMLSRPRWKTEAFLKLLHSSSATSHAETSLGKARREVFSGFLARHLRGLDDVTLYRLHRKMEGKRARVVSEALREASAREGRLGAERRVMGREFSQMAETLEEIHGGLREELARRGFFAKRPRPPQAARARREETALIQSFSRERSEGIRAGGGALSPRLRGRFDALLEEVNEDYAHAGAFADRGDPMSGQLSVTEHFLQDFGRHAMRFETQGAARPDMTIARGTEWDIYDEGARVGISSKMNDFCEGRETQALRLSRLMVGETMDEAWRALTSFRGGANPYLPMGEAGLGGLLYSRDGNAPVMRAERMEDGDIALHIEAASDMQGFRERGATEFRRFEGEKSALACHLHFVIPADPRSPVRLEEDARYDYQIFETPASPGATLPANWARPV